MARLAEEFNKKIKTILIEKFNYKNSYQVPKINKIVLNMGVGEAKEDAKILGTIPIKLNFIDLNKSKNIPNIKNSTIPKDLIWELNKDCSMLL